VSATTLSTPQRIANPFLVIERILRDRNGVWRQVSHEERLNELIVQMLISASASFAIYGAIMGIWNLNVLQMVASAIKLPVLFLLTLGICLPTLYLFNLVFGSTLTVRQALALVLAAITVTAVLTLAFAPISLFFLLTARDYEFFKLLNVAILTLTGVVGLRFLVGGMRSLNLLTGPALPAPPAPLADEATGAPTRTPAIKDAEPTANMSLVWMWIVLYGFVGTQLAWTLRPFFGDPGKPFEIFRPLEGNFYVNVVNTIASLFS
jgi:hypothetical protein